MAKIQKQKDKEKDWTVEKYSTLADMDFDGVLVAVRKKFGQTSVIVPSDGTAIFDKDVLPSGSMMLNEALGIGGFPSGRIVEVYGSEGGGKTTLALGVIAEAQKMGKRVAFIDAENALDRGLAEGIGVDVDNMLISQPDFGEEALEILHMLVASNKFAVIVVDSVAALVPKSELEGEVGDTHMGLQARMMGQGIRKISGIVKKTNTCVIFINQLRTKIGVMFGDPNDTPGGRALKFFASMRIDVRRIGSIKSGENVIGNRVKMTVVKNKLASPSKVVETDLIFGKGFIRESELVEVALKKGEIGKKGSWMVYGDQKFPGKQAAVEFFKQNPAEFDSLRNKLVAQIVVIKENPEDGVGSEEISNLDVQEDS